MPITVVDRQPTFVEALWHTRVGVFVKRGLMSSLKFYGFVLLAVFFGSIGDATARALVANTKDVGDIGSWIVGLPVLVYAVRRPIRWTWRVVFRRPAGLPADLADPPVPSDEPRPSEPDPESLYLGLRLDTGEPASLDVALRHRHLYVVGKSGTGKTTLLKRLVIQDMEAGRGVAVIDPHGDLARDLLGYVPPLRTHDVVYFDPTLPTCPSFNPFALGFDPPKLQADIVSAFKMFFGSSWGDRLEFLLSYSLLTLLTDTEPHSLGDLRRLVVNDEYRAALVDRITSKSLRDFWTYQFEGAKPSIPALANKLGQFLMPTSPLERIFSDPRNDLDFPRIMNEGKIFIANLAKGQIGDDPSRLLGGLIATGVQQAALARATMSDVDRRPFTLYVDEFQNYCVASFETILSEARKYNLSLVLANQTLGQLPSSLQAAIFGNVATLLSFAVSHDDATRLRREMHKSRILVRIRESPDYVSLADFVAYQKDLYRKALADKKYLGMTREECRDYDAMYSDMRGALAASRRYNARRAEIEHMLGVLDRPDLNVATLRELFRDYDFREESFPEVDDFLNLPPHHGLCRIERADNVFPFRAPLPPPGDSARCAAVLARQRAEAPPSPPSPTIDDPSPAMVPPTTSEPTKADEDFHFRF